MRDGTQPRLPFVSIVIPTWNRALLLADCLASLRVQNYPQDSFEIIVVDDGSIDGTPQMVRQFQDGHWPEVRYLRQENRGPNAARNAGITAARGEPICLVDDDIEAPPGWLRAMVTGALRHPQAGAVGGPIRVRLEGKHPRFCGREPLVGESELDLGPEEQSVKEVISANMAVRGWALCSVGLFDESLPIYGDELEWEKRLTRAGYTIVYLPAARLWHRRTAADLRWSALLRRYFRRGLHYVPFARRTGEEVSVRKILQTIPLDLAHAIRRRCTLGILMVAQRLGVLWGLFSKTRLYHYVIGEGGGLQRRK